MAIDAMDWRSSEWGLVWKRFAEADFKKGMALLILVSVVLMWFLEKAKRVQIPDNRLFASIMGTISGFSTMVGNLADLF